MNIQSSTIAHNTAFGVAGSAIGGGLLFTSGPTFLPQTPRIVSSTISGNTAPTAGGASITWRYGSFEMDNSTVAFNSAEPGSAAGLAVTGCYTHLLSSILAENVGGSPDLVTNQSCNSYQLPVLDGMGSIVMSSNQQPTNTTVANPHLAPLAWHGGPTQVHALSANSVAIGHGANPRNFDNDQRGPGFPRTIGHITDSGAYQRQINNDELFFSGFDD
ncbi:MAG: choice-of-anchor Q domain-containing protein, partial [Rudaea sp.]